MKRKNINIYKQFFSTFTIILVLPIIIFMLSFGYFNRKIYEDKLIEHIEHSLSTSTYYIESHLDALYMTVQYHSQRSYMQDMIVKKDVIGKEIVSALSGISATNPFLISICYYNCERPNRMYTSEGNYDLSYYTENYLDMDQKQFLEEVENVKKWDWISVQKKSEEKTEYLRLYYIIRGEGTSDWWLFQIKKESLNQILLENDVQVRLLNTEGNVIYEITANENKDIAFENIVTLKENSEKGNYILEKNIYKNQIFEEMKSWWNDFMVVTIVILLIGGWLICRFTNWHIKPLEEFHEYCQDKEIQIPNAMKKGFKIYLYMIKAMDMKIEHMNELQKREHLLLKMLWDGNNCTKEFLENVKKEGLFLYSKYYQVILADIRGEINFSLADSCYELMTLQDYEVHVVETGYDSKNIIIVGTLNEDRQALEKILERISRQTGAEVDFYIGTRGEGIKYINVSYQQALLSRRSVIVKEKGRLVYYQSVVENKTVIEDEHLIEKVCEYIEGNIGLYDLNVSFVADYFNISASNLSHRFKRQMNQTISDYIAEKKFNYAATLLRETESNIMTIAAMAGYNQPAGFIRKFKSIYGMTPSRYRSIYKKEQDKADEN